MMREWLKNARKQSGMTAKDVAEALGICESYYCYIESGKRKKRLDTTLCAKLAKIFCLPVLQSVEFEEGGADDAELARTKEGGRQP